MFKGVYWEQFSGLVQRLAMFGAGILAANPSLAETRWGQILGGVIALVGILYGVKINTSASLVASVNGLSGVKGVVPMNNSEGRAIQEAVDSPTVAVAGTAAAATIAKPGATP